LTDLLAPLAGGAPLKSETTCQMLAHQPVRLGGWLSSFPTRRTVTIIAGFKSPEGVVICADTQETIAHLKRNVPKLRFEPSGDDWTIPRNKGDDLAVAFCGAGDGSYIDKITESSWQMAKDHDSLDSVCLAIEANIKNTYQEFGQIYQPGYCPNAQIIFSAKMHQQSRLFQAEGPIVNEVKGCCSGGVGIYMADFLSSRMYHNRLNIYQCAILAAYVLLQAKEHVDGCGGQSNIAVLRNNGSSGMVDWQKVDVMTKLLGSADDTTARLLLNASNLEIEDTEFEKQFQTSKEVIQMLREHHRSELKTWDYARKALGGTDEDLDSLGLPL
jgi:20S proteasome alpha/beta subunit